MNSFESPVQRIEREKQEQIEKIKHADTLMRKISDLKDKQAQLEDELAHEVQRLMSDEGLTAALLRNLGLPVPRKSRTQPNTRTEDHTTTETTTAHSAY